MKRSEEEVRAAADMARQCIALLVPMCFYCLGLEGMQKHHPKDTLNYYYGVSAALRWLCEDVKAPVSQAALDDLMNIPQAVEERRRPD
jgi:hypothetical protein